MKRILTAITALSLLAGTGAAFAQPGHDDHHPGPAMSMSMHGPAHPDWRKGGRIGRDDWGRGVTVEYHAHHLRRPPRGYEWRQVDGNYILAAAATGLIASIIIAGH